MNNKIEQLKTKIAKLTSEQSQYLNSMLLMQRPMGWVIEYDPYYLQLSKAISHATKELAVLQQRAQLESLSIDELIQKITVLSDRILDADLFTARHLESTEARRIRAALQPELRVLHARLSELDPDKAQELVGEHASVLFQPSGVPTMADVERSADPQSPDFQRPDNRNPRLDLDVHSPEFFNDYCWHRRMNSRQREDSSSAGCNGTNFGNDGI